MTAQRLADLALAEDQQRRAAERAGDLPRARAHAREIARLIALIP